MKRRFIYTALSALILAACGGSDDRVAALEQEIEDLRRELAAASSSTTTTVPDSVTTTAANTTSTASPNTTTSQELGPSTDSEFVAGTFDAGFPTGTTTDVELVVVNRISDTLLGVVVRNNTASPVTRISVSGTIRDAQGNLLASGSDQGLNPFRVEPGGIAFGYIYLGLDAKIEADTVFSGDYSIGWNQAGSEDRILDLIPTEWIVRDSGRSIVLILSNPHTSTVTGPIGVEVYCFDDAGNPYAYDRTFTDQDTILPGGTASATATFRGSCESFLIASSGFRAR